MRYHMMRRHNRRRVRWQLHPFRDGPQSDSHSKTGRPVGQISPDKDVNFCYTTAAFTLSPEPRALVCCATLPFEVALYAISVRLIALRSGFLQAVPKGSALAFG
jgi:hypothetical protein